MPMLSRESLLLSRDGLFSVAKFQEYQQSDPVLGIVISVLRCGGKQFPDTNPALHQWSTKQQFLFLGKDDG